MATGQSQPTFSEKILATNNRKYRSHKGKRYTNLVEEQTVFLLVLHSRAFGDITRDPAWTV